MRRSASDGVDRGFLQVVPLVVRYAHDRRISGKEAGTQALITMGTTKVRWPASAGSVYSVLAGRRAPQVPAGAKVALVRMQRDARLEPADIGGAQRVLLGREDGLGCPIGAPVRTERERPVVIAPLPATALWKVAAAHHPILA